MCYIKPVWSWGSIAKRWWPCLSVIPSFADFGWPSTIDNVWISSNITSTYHQCMYAIRLNRLMRGCNIFHTMYAIAYVARSRMLKRTRFPYSLSYRCAILSQCARRYAQKCWISSRCTKYTLPFPFAPFIDRNQMMRISLRKMDESLILYGLNCKYPKTTTLWRSPKLEKKQEQERKSIRYTTLYKSVIFYRI